MIMRSLAMKPVAILGVCALLIAGTPRTSQSQVIHIDFDHAADGRAIVSGTVVDTIYARAYGVTFDAVRCPTCGSDPHVYVSANCRPGAVSSLPNSVTLYGDNTCDPISEHLGTVRATFSTLADSVCIHAMSVRIDDYAVLRAYDGAGLEIARGYSHYGTLEDICVSVPGIKSVAFSGAILLYAWFDDLCVRMGGATSTRSPSWGKLKSMYR
jgi:hypothetical protein